MLQVFEQIKNIDFRTIYAGRFSKKDAVPSAYILSEDFLTDVERLEQGDYFFTPPELLLVPKTKDHLRRTYRYGLREKAILGCINEALHMYDGIFSSHAYSQVRNRGFKYCRRAVLDDPTRKGSYACYLDLTRFGESLDCSILCNLIDNYLSEDKAFNSFLHTLINDKRYMDNGKLCLSERAVSVGNPLETFWNNLYLTGYDREMEMRALSYYRFCDDILFFAKDAASLSALLQFTKDYMAGLKLKINLPKIQMAAPGESIFFLNCLYKDSGVEKTFMTAPAKRLIDEKRVRALKLKRKYSLGSVKAMEVFLTSLRFFHQDHLYGIYEMILDADVIKAIDAYLQDALRQVGSGKKTAAKYRIRYEDMKKAGYHSMVNEYYKYIKQRRSDRQ